MKHLITSILLLLLISKPLICNANPYPDRDKRFKIVLSIKNKKLSILVNSVYVDAEFISNKYGLPIELIISEIAHKFYTSDKKESLSLKNLLRLKNRNGLIKFVSNRECFDYWAKRISRCHLYDVTYKDPVDWLCSYNRCGFVKNEKHYTFLNKFIVGLLND